MKIEYLNLEGVTFNELREIERKINEIIDRINIIEKGKR